MKFIFFNFVVVTTTSLVASSVSAEEYNSLKASKDFESFDSAGVSEKETDGRVQLTVVPVTYNAIKYLAGNGDKV